MRRDREEILKSAAQYVNRYGVRTVSMQDIAEAVDISRSSLYYHFTEKSDLLYEVLISTLNEFCARVREIMDYPLPAAQRLTVLLRAVLKLETENPGVPVTLILRDGGTSLKPEQRDDVLARRNEYEGYFRRLIDEGIASGEFRTVNAKVVTAGILGILEKFDAWFDPRGPLAAEQIADIFADLYLAALASEGEPGPHSGKAARKRGGR